MDTNPNISIHVIAFTLGVSHCSVQRTFASSLYAVSCPKIPIILSDNSLTSARFAQWYLQQSAQDVNFPVCFVHRCVHFQSAQCAFVGVRET